MKKSLKIAVAASVLTAPAMAVNMENPLFIPTTGQYYSKTGAGVMYKKTDHTEALKSKDMDGKNEFPIWRLSEDAGYGITDRLSVSAKLGYTNDEDISRSGLHNGRIGLLYRIFNGVESPFVWDVYADLHLGGMSTMEADVIPVTGDKPLGFKYDNYTNGRWGFFAGTRIGKTWDKFTGSVYGEVHQTFGNHNNNIELTSGAKSLIGAMVADKLSTTSLSGLATPIANAYVSNLPDAFNVKLKSTTEYLTGINGFYQFNESWSFGSGFGIRHRATNTIESVNLDVDADADMAAIHPAVVAAIAGGALSSDALTESLSNRFVGSIEDGLDEYVFSFAVANQITQTVQVALYGEYTFDDSDTGSQNGTDAKAEVGVRANVAF